MSSNVTAVKCYVCGRLLGDFLPTYHPDHGSTMCKSCFEVDQVKNNKQDSQARHEMEFLENQSGMLLENLVVCSTCKKTRAKCACDQFVPVSTIDDRTTEPDEEDEEYWDED